MLVAVVCGCHGAEPLVRNFLSSHHHPDPFSVHIYKAEEGKSWVKKNNLSYIETYLDSRSTYAIIVGWDSPENIHWADINNAHADRLLKAEVIVDKFK